jgi:purine-binding chemotaxis protein CheW
MIRKNKNKDMIQLVIFHLGTEVFGIDIKNVDEIVKVTNITRIPRSPSYLLGVANLRGSIFPVLDIHQRFELGKCNITESSRILVINIDGNKSGLIIDEIKEVIRLKEDLIESSTAISKIIKEEFLDNVIKIKNRDGVVSVLKLSSICKMNIEDDLDIAIAREKEKALAIKSTEIQLISFFIENEEYSIKLKGVREIVRISDVVRIPNSPDYVRGLISHRENLLPVIDLRIKFNKSGLSIDDYSEHARIVVVDLHDITFGILVEKVNGIVRVFKDLIESPPDLISSVETDQLSGIVKLDNGNRLIMLLNLENIISLDEIRRIQSSEEIKKTKIERGIFKSFELEESLISFRLGNEEFAIKINRVQEIIRFQEITRLPNAIYFMEGVINLRGEVIPVFNLRKRFNLKDSVSKNKQKMIIIHISDKKAGLIVDSVSEVLHIEKKNIESLPEAVKSSVSMEFMSGIVRISERKRILILLNLEMILTEEEKKHFLGFGDEKFLTKASSDDNISDRVRVAGIKYNQNSEETDEVIAEIKSKEENSENDKDLKYKLPEIKPVAELKSKKNDEVKEKMDSVLVEVKRENTIFNENKNIIGNIENNQSEPEKTIKKKSSMKRAR